MTCNTTLGAVLDWPSFSTFSYFCSADMWISGINIFKTCFHIIHPSYSWQVLIVLVIFCLFVLSTIMWYGVSHALPEANIACASLPFRSMCMSMPRVLNISSLGIYLAVSYKGLSSPETFSAQIPALSLTIILTAYLPQLVQSCKSSIPLLTYSDKNIGTAFHPLDLVFNESWVTLSTLTLLCSATSTSAE